MKKLNQKTHKSKRKKAGYSVFFPRKVFRCISAAVLGIVLMAFPAMAQETVLISPNALAQLQNVSPADGGVQSLTMRADEFFTGASGITSAAQFIEELKKYQPSDWTSAGNNGDILGAGDLVIQWCHTHDDRPHVIICAGYDDEGYAVYYGHNQAMNKKRFQLGDSMAYMHNHDCDMRAYVLHVSSLDPNASDFDTNASQSNGKNPPPAAQPPVLNVHSASSITQTTIHISGSCSYSGTKPSSVGIYMGTSQESMSRVDSDNINHNKNPFDIWYDLTDLTPGTTYYYQLYAIAGEEEIKTQILSFTTAAQDEPPTIHSKSAKNITPTSVRIEGNCAYSGARPSSVGLYLGTDTASMPRVDSDNINHNKNPFDIWYDLNNLSPSTTYYYQLYAVVDGETYTSTVLSFTTPN